MAAKKASASRKTAPPSNVHIALLRGVNVGGNNGLPMKDLAAMFVAAGCENVRTYIQSGNVVCTASAALAKKLPALIECAITAHAGHSIPIVMRSAVELQKAVHANPFLARGVDASSLHLGFLVDAPNKARIATLDPARSPPDEFRVHGREVYFHFPAGLGKSKLTSAYFDSKLGTTLTIRNWRTVLKLLEMAAEPS
jgi:uncharacterized protein (DUF1697 family)